MARQDEQLGSWQHQNQCGAEVWRRRTSVACGAEEQTVDHVVRECGAEEQTVDHVVRQCPIHRPAHGLRGLTVLDDEKIEWLLNTFPEI